MNHSSFFFWLKCWKCHQLSLRIIQTANGSITQHSPRNTHSQTSVIKRPRSNVFTLSSLPLQGKKTSSLVHCGSNSSAVPLGIITWGRRISHLSYLTRLTWLEAWFFLRKQNTATNHSNWIWNNKNPSLYIQKLRSEICSLLIWYPKPTAVIMTL